MAPVSRAVFIGNCRVTRGVGEFVHPATPSNDVASHSASFVHCPLQTVPANESTGRRYTASIDRSCWHSIVWCFVVAANWKDKRLGSRAVAETARCRTLLL